MESDKKLEIGDMCSFIIDTETYTGKIIKKENNTVSVLCYMGIVNNIPIEELENLH